MKNINREQREGQFDLAHPQFFLLFTGGLGKSLGEASSAHTALGLSRWLPMTDRSSLGVEGWLPGPSGGGPYEALKRGLPRPGCSKVLKSLKTLLP